MHLDSLSDDSGAEWATIAGRAKALLRCIGIRSYTGPPIYEVPGLGQYVALTAAGVKPEGEADKGIGARVGVSDLYIKALLSHAQDRAPDGGACWWRTEPSLEYDEATGRWKVWSRLLIVKNAPGSILESQAEG